MPTEKQKKVIQKTSENLGSKKVKSKGEILRESDYSEEVSKTPSIVYDSKAVKEELKPFVDKLITERDRVIEAMSEKDLDKVDYEKLSSSLDRKIKNIQLLSGGATSRDEAVEVIEIINPYNESKSETNKETI